MLAGVRALGVTVTCVALRAIAGCGSGSVKKTDYLVRADAICMNAIRATRSIPPPATVGSRRDQLTALAQYLSRLVPVVTSEDTQIRALKRPSGSAQDGAALARYLGALTRSATEYTRLAAAARRRDAAGVADAEASLRATPVASLAAAYGLRACGNAGGTGV